MFLRGNNEKIKVNRQTTNLSLEELINCVELSVNQYVRQVSLESIAAKRDEGGVKYLLHLLQNSENSNRNQVYTGAWSMRISRSKQVSPGICNRSGYRDLYLFNQGPGAS